MMFFKIVTVPSPGVAGNHLVALEDAYAHYGTQAIGIRRYQVSKLKRAWARRKGYAGRSVANNRSI
jgi:hypothetical protein